MNRYLFLLLYILIMHYPMENKTDFFGKNFSDKTRIAHNSEKSTKIGMQ